MLNEIRKELGIRSSYTDDTGMPIFAEPDDLVSIWPDIFGRPQKLVREAAKKWVSMQLAASKDNISLYVVPTFRSVEYQACLIKIRLEKGQSIDEILRVNTAPGHSEHHSGRAFDPTTRDCKPLCEAFEGTEAFHWPPPDTFRNLLFTERISMPS